MPDTPSITLVKKFTYRGLPEEYSNTYHFSGTTPANRAAWKALADQIILAEMTCFEALVSWVRAYGYEAGTDHSVAQIDYSVAPDAPAVTGSFSTATQVMPGDVAATARWWTGEYSEKGKKIYCRKYFHAVHSDGTDYDKITAAQRTALGVFCNKMIDGTLPGGVKYCGPQGAVLQAPEVSQWLTTRTLKRRGKRPPTSP